MPKRIVHFLVAALAVILASAAVPANAAPTKVGPVTNLTLKAAASPAGYSMTSTWTAPAGATSYKAVLTSPAGTLGSITTTATSWTVDVSAAPNTAVTVTVTPYDGKKPGIASSTNTTLPDLAPPVGSFTITRAETGLDATLTQHSLSDNGTPVAQIKREVTWGDGSPAQLWQTGTTLTHNYPAIGRYVATVKLTDTSGNAVTLTLKAVVFGDTTAPGGAFDASPGQAFARWTPVVLTQTALSDDFSPAEFVERVVAWGDGSVEAWPAGTRLTHQFAGGGTFTPTVTLVDEAGNSTKVLSDAVNVVVDATGPVVKVTNRKSASVKKWRVVKGTVSDAGVGAKSVSVVAIIKTATGWKAYAGGSWKRVGSKTKAWKRARAVTVTPAKGAWQARLAKLGKGKLMIRVQGADNLGNSSARLSRTQTLTKA